MGPKGGVDTDSQHCCVAHSRGRAGTELAPVSLQCRLIVLPPAGPQVQKLYIAIVEESMRLEDKGFVGPTARQMQVPSKGRRRAEEAGLAAEEGPVLTQYTVLARCPEEFALLALQPVTGVLMRKNLSGLQHISAKVLAKSCEHSDCDGAVRPSDDWIRIASSWHVAGRQALALSILKALTLWAAQVWETWQQAQVIRRRLGCPSVHQHQRWQ